MKEQAEKRDDIYSVWGDMLKFKFAVAMLLTPLADPLVMMVLTYMASDEERTSYIDDNDMERQKAGEARAIKV